MRRSSRRLDRCLLYVVVLYSLALTLILLHRSTPRPPPPPPRVIYRRDYSSSTRPTTFLVGIFTVMEDVQRRRLIRETMLGREMPEQERLCSLQTYLASPGATPSKCQIMYTFVVGGNPQAPTEWSEGNELPRTLDASQMLKHEQDILYLNIKENMNDGKTPSWFDYASTLENIDYVSKADSDSLISIPQLLSYVNGHLPPATQHPKVYGGFLNEYQACGGSGELCDKIRGKVYMSGQFYWLSRDLTVYLSQVSKTSHRNFIKTANEDSDMGIRLLSYPEPLSLSTCNGAQFWIHTLKAEQSWLDEFHKLVAKNWQVTDTSNWIGGLYDTASEQDLVQSVLGRIRETESMPIILD